MSILQMSKQALGGEATSPGLPASPGLGSHLGWDLRRARPPAGGAVAPWSEASLGTGSRPLLWAGRGAARGHRVWGSRRPRSPHGLRGTLPSLGLRSRRIWPEWGPRRGLAWLLSAFRGPGPAGDTSGRGAGYRGASAVVVALREGVRQWERVLESSVRPSSCHSRTRLGHALLLWAPTLACPSYPGGGAWEGAGSRLGTEVQLPPRAPALVSRGSVTNCHKRGAPKTTRIRPLRDLGPEVPTQVGQGGAPSGPLGERLPGRRAQLGFWPHRPVSASVFMWPLCVFSPYEDTCGM